MTKRMLIMAGGTGGHIFPALAVAEQLKQEGHEVCFLGTASGLEAKLVPAHKFTLLTLNIVGVRGHKLSRKLLSPLLLLRAIWQAIRIIKKFKPDVVLGMGGFVSGPGGIAAFLLRKPLYLHEQNAVAGTTNRYLSKFAKHIFSAFPNTFPRASNEICVGNPVRRSLCDLPAPSERYAKRTGPINILVLGGSRGAMALNLYVPQALSQLKKPIMVWHQAGEAHFDQAKQAYRECGIEAKIDAFIDDMSTVYAWADLVICRSGAMTVSEIAAVGIAVVFIPFPHAIDDHQTKNAASLANEKAAIVVKQSADMVERLSVAIDGLLDRQVLIDMAEHAYSVRKIHAVEKIVTELNID
ncbi:MAG: undecaprenyldiphospho-muramoylpentapeptide beta-N-acetylglucosaminyltransferase [Legionellaceae bacterium]|nr:undecaprenyldiphospho-muramoylpentapeptide beta-N-acetylglucosaminyltransferase [Legionellaceae bacterium]